jgi:hypothetical protein
MHAGSVLHASYVFWTAYLRVGRPEPPSPAVTGTDCTSRISRLASLGPEQHSACPICGKQWVRHWGHNVAPYHRPRS